MCLYDGWMIKKIVARTYNGIFFSLNKKVSWVPNVEALILKWWNLKGRWMDALAGVKLRSVKKVEPVTLMGSMGSKEEARVFSLCMWEHRAGQLSASARDLYKNHISRHPKFPNFQDGEKWMAVVSATWQPEQKQKENLTYSSYTCRHCEDTQLTEINQIKGQLCVIPCSETTQGPGR